MYQIILITHIIIAVVLITLVLVTQTRGGGMGAIGSGASQTVFGSQGSTSFLFRLTSACAALFFATSLGLSFLVYKQQKPKNALGFTVTAAQIKPAVDKQEKPEQKSAAEQLPTPVPAPDNQNTDNGILLKSKDAPVQKEQKPLIHKQ